VTKGNRKVGWKKDKGVSGRTCKPATMSKDTVKPQSKTGDTLGRSNEKKGEGKNNFGQEKATLRDCSAR